MIPIQRYARTLLTGGLVAPPQFAQLDRLDVGLQGPLPLWSRVHARGWLRA